MKEDIYFITELSGREENWPQFPELPIGIVEEMQLIYVQRYVNLNIVEPTKF